MSVDTIYKRQFLSFQQAALHELIGVNLADVRQLQDEIIDKSDKFTKGIIPENEAADFARETSEKVLEYEIHAGEELQRLQEGQEKPSVEKFLGGLSEEQKNLIRNETENMSEITPLENLITELKRLCEMAWCFTAHIQDYATTPEYRERRRNFLRTGEPAPDTQAPEAGIPGFVLSIAGYYPKFLNHYPELEGAEYIKKTDTGLQWLKTKQSLAEYFSAIKPKTKRNNWVILENIFSVKDLRSAVSQNGSPFKGKKSKDFEALQGIITI
jgi:hypothetical protein